MFPLLRKKPSYSMKLRIQARFKGGPGSGHFDHRGRPGKIGGSLPSESFGQPTGLHTSEGQKKVIDYLERETGWKFKPYGSLREGGKISENDIDIAIVEPEYTEAELDAMWIEDMKWEDKLRDKYSAGKLTEEEFYNELYGDPNEPDDITKALGNLGYEYVSTAAWLGMQVNRYESKKTDHAIEIWSPSDAGYYGNFVTAEKGGPGSGNFGHAGRPGEVGGSAPGERVWQGERHEPTGKRLTRLEVGERGESIASMALSDRYGAEFVSLNQGINNAPIDLGGDHKAVEVKTGLATNSATAMHWRATIGQPGKAEAELLKSMSSKEKRDHNVYKRQQILKRKYDMLTAMSEMAGDDIEPLTVGIILSEDGTRGDVYEIPGFHQRLTWKDYATDKYYVGTYDYED